MRQIEIEDRRKKVLSAIIEDYIDSGMPVGSRTVSQGFRWTMSPASIRNIMADLEEMGLISHPYTSAGRVPTDKGYRFYVDCLLAPCNLTKDERDMISKLIDSHYGDFETLMQTISKALSVITNALGVVLTPRLKRGLFKHIEFISIEPTRFLAVLVTKSGFVKNAMIELGEDISQNDILSIERFLNQELEGMFLGDIKTYLTQKLLQQQGSFYAFLKKVINIISMPSLLRMDDKIYFEGASTLLSYPEFKDISKMRLFLMSFEDPKDILKLLNEDMEQEGIKVHIGKENPCLNMHNCSIVTCNYSIKDMVVGALAIIGPTRMPYGKVISTVDYFSKILTNILEEIG